MNLSIDKLPECRAKISAEVPNVKVCEIRDGVVDAFMAQAKLPGFRPGKLPRKVVEKKFKSGIEEELRERLVRAVIREAHVREDLEILGVAAEERAVFEADGVFTYICEVVTKPEVELSEEDYKNIPVEVEKQEVTDEMIEEFLGRVQQNFASYEETAEESKPGDKVWITFTATRDGAPLTKSIPEQAHGLAVREEPLEFDLPREDQKDGRELIPGLSDGLVGVNAGDTIVMEIDFGEDFFVPELNGVRAEYSVDVHDVRRVVLPEIDDDLAEEIGFETLEELRESYRRETEGRFERARVNQIEQAILTHLNREHEFDLPPQQVFQETQHQVNRMVTNAYQQGLQPDDIDKHEKEIVDSASERAVANLKTRYLLDEIAEKEKIQVEEEELMNHILLLAQRENKSPKKVVREIQDGPGIENFRADLLISKTIAFLRENASVTLVDAKPSAD